MDFDLDKDRAKLVALVWKVAEENSRLKDALRRSMQREQCRKDLDCLCSWTCERHRGEEIVVDPYAETVRFEYENTVANGLRK